jgi:Fe-S-cluster containining protein
LESSALFSSFYLSSPECGISSNIKGKIELGKLATIKDSSPSWYRDGLPFKCTGCGKCCSGSPGYVWINEQEMTQLAELLKITLEQFIKKYTRLVGNRYSLIEMFKGNGIYDCVFLEDNRCTVYQARPTQCKTFPWWPQNLESKKDWHDTAAECEGIHSDAPLVDHEEIEKQLAIYHRSKEIC